MIDKIVEIAKEAIDSSGIRLIDITANFYYGLLVGLGYQDRADEVYDYYKGDDKDTVS